VREDRKAARHALRAIERLSQRGGRTAMAATFGFLTLAAVTYPGVLLVADTGGCSNDSLVYDNQCGNLHNSLGLAGVVLLMLESQAAVLCAAAWATQAAAARRRHAVASDTAPRLHLAKQVYAAGRIEAGEFEAFKRRATPFADGAHEALAHRRNAGLLVAVGIVSTSMAVLTAPYTLGMLRDGLACASCDALASTVHWTARLVALAALLLLVGLAFLGWAVGFPLQRRATHRLAEALTTLVQQEERLLSLANRSPAPAVETMLSARRPR
jgi:hypothetical protein